MSSWPPEPPEPFEEPARPIDAPELELLQGADGSLLDLVDHLLNQGVVVTGEVILGIADVDLVYLRITALLCAADRVLPRQPRPAPGHSERAVPASDRGSAPAEAAQFGRLGRAPRPAVPSAGVPSAGVPSPNPLSRAPEASGTSPLSRTPRRPARPAAAPERDGEPGNPGE